MAEKPNLAKLAKESKEAFAARDFKLASRLFNEIKEAHHLFPNDLPNFTYVQQSDGTIHYVLKREDGSNAVHPQTKEYVTAEVK